MLGEASERVGDTGNAVVTGALIIVALYFAREAGSSDHVSDDATTFETKIGTRQIQNAELFDEPKEETFSLFATSLARSLEAPIALITASDGHRRFWEAQCGLTDDILTAGGSEWDLSMCSKIVFADSALVLADTSEDQCFANDQFLKGKGVRFYAGAPLKAADGQVLVPCAFWIRGRGRSRSSRRNNLPRSQMT